MPNKKAHLLKKLSLKSRLVLAAVVWLTGDDHRRRCHGPISGVCLHGR